MATQKPRWWWGGVGGYGFGSQSRCRKRSSRQKKPTHKKHGIVLRQCQMMLHQFVREQIETNIRYVRFLELLDNTDLGIGRGTYASLSCSTTRIWECRISTVKRLLSFSQNEAGGAENDGTNTDRKITRVNADGNRQKHFTITFLIHYARPPTCNGCHPMPF